MRRIRPDPHRDRASEQNASSRATPPAAFAPYFRLLLLCLPVLFSALAAAQPSSGPYLATPQRPTFTSDTSTTAPGTIELETGGTFSDGLFSLGNSIKFTPDVFNRFFRTGEFSANFDAVTVLSSQGRSQIRFGDRIVMRWRRPFFSSGGFSAAVAPHVTALLRDASGARFGATGILAYSAGRSAAVFNAAIGKATSASPGNPSKSGALLADFVHTISDSGAWSKVSVFAGVQSDHATGSRKIVSLGQGVSWRVRPNLVFDAALRETRLNLPQKDIQFLFGLTINLGRLLPG